MNEVSPATTISMSTTSEEVSLEERLMDERRKNTLSVATLIFYTIKARLVLALNDKNKPFKFSYDFYIKHANYPIATDLFINIMAECNLRTWLDLYKQPKPSAKEFDREKLFEEIDIVGKAVAYALKKAFDDQFKSYSLSFNVSWNSNISYLSYLQGLFNFWATVPNYENARNMFLRVSVSKIA